MSALEHFTLGLEHLERRQLDPTRRPPSSCAKRGSDTAETGNCGGQLTPRALLPHLRTYQEDPPEVQRRRRPGHGLSPSLPAGQLVAKLRRVLPRARFDLFLPTPKITLRAKCTRTHAPPDLHRRPQVLRRVSPADWDHESRFRRDWGFSRKAVPIQAILGQ